MKDAEILHLSPVKRVAFPDAWYEYCSTEHFWFAWRFAAFQTLLAHIGVDPARTLEVLDIGGGSGVLRQQIERATSWTVDVADINETALRGCPPGRGRQLYYDVEDRREELVSAYDMVTLFDVLEHVEDGRALLCACRDHLRRGGLFCINVPALKWLYGHYDRVAGHLVRYTRSSLNAELTPLGLRVMGLRYWGFSLVPLVGLRQLLLAGRPDERETIRRGFAPPGRLFNRLMRAVMRVETVVVRNPWMGTSVLAICRREDD